MYDRRKTSWIRSPFAIAVLVALWTSAACAKSPAAPTALALSTQPASQTVEAGSRATLNVHGTGAGVLRYQWYRGPAGTTASPIDGATAETYETPPLTETTSYWVRVADNNATVDSATATITVLVPDVTSTTTPPAPDPPAPPPPPEPPAPDPDPPPPPPPAPTAPAIETQPHDQSIAYQQTATLTVGATGSDPLSYQWYRGPSGSTAQPIDGATSAWFTTPSLTATTSYWVRVSNVAGSVDSATATITVAADTSGSAWEEEVLALVNQQRAAGATCGGTAYAPAAPLHMDEALRAAARAHSLDMAINNYFSHVSLDGRTFDQRIRNAGYTGAFPLGENIAAGHGSPAAVVSGWMASPGHCVNIMHPGFKAIGVGYVYRPGSAYKHYWAQSFGGS